MGGLLDGAHSSPCCTEGGGGDKTNGKSGDTKGMLPHKQKGEEEEEEKK